MKRKIIYPTLERELDRVGISRMALARQTGIGYQLLLKRLSGYIRITLDEAFRIKAVMNSELTLDELFAKGERECMN